MEDRKEWKTGEKSDIEIRNLSVSFQDGGETVHAMEGVNAYFPAGSVTGLIGESGSGKSLLGMSILGLLSGQARVDGTCMYKGMDTIDQKVASKRNDPRVNGYGAACGRLGSGLCETAVALGAASARAVSCGLKCT